MNKYLNLMILTPMMLLTSIAYSSISNMTSIEVKTYTQEEPNGQGPALQFDVDLTHETLKSLADKIINAVKADPRFNGLSLTSLVLGASPQITIPFSQLNERTLQKAEQWYHQPLFQDPIFAVFKHLNYVQITEPAYPYGFGQNH